MIIIDPPWFLASNDPVRGPAIPFNHLTDDALFNLHFEQVQQNGFVFLSIVNSKRLFAEEMLHRNGHVANDIIAWIKATSTGKIAHNIGFHFTHSKELCLVAKKGKL